MNKSGVKVIGKVTTKSLTGTDDQHRIITIPGTTYEVIDVIQDRGVTYYVTNQFIDRDEDEMLVIVDILVQSYEELK